MTAELVVAALNMVLHTRKPDSVIHHSDQGSQYTGLAFGQRCQDMGVRPSMDSGGDAYDNAMAESFFASLECELIARRSWKTKAEAHIAVFTWIEAWYDHGGQCFETVLDEDRLDAYKLMALRVQVIALTGVLGLKSGNRTNDNQRSRSAFGPAWVRALPRLVRFFSFGLSDDYTSGSHPLNVRDVCAPK